MPGFFSLRGPVVPRIPAYLGLVVVLEVCLNSRIGTLENIFDLLGVDIIVTSLLPFLPPIEKEDIFELTLFDWLGGDIIDILSFSSMSGVETVATLEVIVFDKTGSPFLVVIRLFVGIGRLLANLFLLILFVCCVVCFGSPSNSGVA